jgi:predicted transcriptional regulator with HTH domain
MDRMQLTSELQIALARRSLRRSYIRKKIVEYLEQIRPQGSYLSDISYNIDTAPSNVSFAIRGYKERFRKEESLIQLKLVEEINCGNKGKTTIYRITELGSEVVKSLK